MDAHSALVDAKAYLDGVVSMLTDHNGMVAMPAFSLLQLLRPVQHGVKEAIENLESEGAQKEAVILVRESGGSS